MKTQIFLSASIPIRGREPYDQDIETKRIRDAILALVTVCKDRDLVLVFGGHPAISPIVHHAANSLGTIENIVIYQSEFYRKFLPEAAWKFPNLIWAPAGDDGRSSQAIMRDAMINDKTWQYGAAVFIGGMQGVIDEARRFHAMYPGKPMIPLQYTGGASRILIGSPELRSNFAWRIPECEEAATSMLRYRRLLDRSLATT
jgi:SLOG cluster3 family